MPESFCIYKARKDNKGVASQFSFNAQKKAIFLEMADQMSTMDENNNATFDWKSKICFKLGVNDIGEILAVLHGIKNAVGAMSNGNYGGLYHKNKEGDAILTFTKDSEKRNFYIRLSIRRGDVNKKMQHSISHSEGMILAILLKKAVESIYEW